MRITRLWSSRFRGRDPLNAMRFRGFFALFVVYSVIAISVPDKHLIPFDDDNTPHPSYRSDPPPDSTRPSSPTPHRHDLVLYRSGATVVTQPLAFTTGFQESRSGASPDGFDDEGCNPPCSCDACPPQCVISHSPLSPVRALRSPTRHVTIQIVASRIPPATSVGQWTPI